VKNSPRKCKNLEA
jgi:hypothetical protein